MSLGKRVSRAPESMPTSAQTMKRNRGSASMRSRRNGSVRASHPAKRDLCTGNVAPSANRRSETRPDRQAVHEATAQLFIQLQNEGQIFPPQPGPIAACSQRFAVCLSEAHAVRSALTQQAQ